MFYRLQLQIAAVFHDMNDNICNDTFLSCSICSVLSVLPFCQWSERASPAAHKGGGAELVPGEGFEPAAEGMAKQPEG